jgi:hypothetical protein
MPHSVTSVLTTEPTSLCAFDDKQASTNCFPQVDAVISIHPILSQPSTEGKLHEEEEDDYPEGGRGWLVVLGCFIQASMTLGVLIFLRSTLDMRSAD